MAAHCSASRAVIAPPCSPWKAKPSAGRRRAVSQRTVDGGRWYTVQLPVKVDLPASGSAELVVKLPSPLVAANDRARLLAIDAAAARAETLKFWSDYLARGMRIEVPEAAVNDLFRANLWHALRLPRRHGGEGPESPVEIDLPYSNFAYDQTGTPWPVNQAVYVDYMLYDLRGYPQVAEEELLAIFRNSQEPNGHLKGVANWGVYTPGMLYAVAQHYRLSGDRAVAPAAAATDAQGPGLVPRRNGQGGATRRARPPD